MESLVTSWGGSRQSDESLSQPEDGLKEGEYTCSVQEQPEGRGTELSEPRGRGPMDPRGDMLLPPHPTPRPRPGMVRTSALPQWDGGHWRVLSRGGT